MTRPVLLLQNTPDLPAPTDPGALIEAAGRSVERRWAYGGDFPTDLSAYGGICLSGGPNGALDPVDFIARERALIVEAAALGLPMFGICLGSQLLAAALCGLETVFRRPRCEVGFEDLVPTPAMAADPLGAGLREAGADRLPMFVWHNDEVRHDHRDMTILATSAACPNHVWRWRDRPVWGVQGHPELDPETARAWFESRRSVLERDGADVDALMRDPPDTPIARDLLRRFAALCL